MGAAKDLWMEAQSRGWSLFDDKYVCPDCFEDEAIKNVILENATRTVCGYCGAKSNKPIAADMNDVMPEIYFGIRQEWGDPNYEGVPWESAEGGWQGNVIDSWDLFHEELELGISSDELRLDLVRSVEDHQWCQRDFWNLPAQRELRSDWDRFSEMVKHQTRFLFLREKNSAPNDRAPHTVLKALGNCFRKLDMVKTLPAGTELIRARRHKATEHFDTMADLGTPPKHKASTNRMSPPGIAMFYGAFDAKTAIAEVCSDPTDNNPMVTAAPFVLKKPMRVIDLTAVPPVPSVFDRQRAKQRVPSLFLRGFVKDFVKPVKKDGREHIEYVPTQIVTEYVRRAFRDQGGKQVHGIVYPSSVADGMSCVLFLESAPDSEWAHLYPDTIEKWLKLDKSKIKSRKVAPHK